MVVLGWIHTEHYLHDTSYQSASWMWKIAMIKHWFITNHCLISDGNWETSQAVADTAYYEIAWTSHITADWQMRHFLMLNPWSWFYLVVAGSESVNTNDWYEQCVEESIPSWRCFTVCRWQFCNYRYLFALKSQVILLTILSYSNWNQVIKIFRGP